jgi:hypothetical protein
MFRFHVGGKTALGVARYALAPSPALSNHTDRARKPSVGSTTIRFLVNCVTFWQYRLMARVTSKNSAPNGSALGFEDNLWSAAEKLKGNMDAGEYKHVVLGQGSNVELVDRTDASSTGTKMPRTNWNDIARFEFALPPASRAAEFAAMINPMIDRIIANIHESQTLAEWRDSLLPKLLSGELSTTGRIE